MGVSPDTLLPELWTIGRVLRIADGPDEVHMRSIARQEIKLGKAKMGDSHRFYLRPDRSQESDARNRSGADRCRRRRPRPA